MALYIIMYKVIYIHKTLFVCVCKDCLIELFIYFGFQSCIEVGWLYDKFIYLFNSVSAPANSRSTVGGSQDNNVI